MLCASLQLETCAFCISRPLYNGFFPFLLPPRCGKPKLFGSWPWGDPGVGTGAPKIPQPRSPAWSCCRPLPAGRCRGSWLQEELERVQEKGFCPGGHQASRAQNLSFLATGMSWCPGSASRPLLRANLLRGMNWGQPGAAGCWVPRQNTPGEMGREASISPVCAPEPGRFQPWELPARSMCSMPSSACAGELAGGCASPLPSPTPSPRLRVLSGSLSLLCRCLDRRIQRVAVMPNSLKKKKTQHKTPYGELGILGPAGSALARGRFTQDPRPEGLGERRRGR